MDRYGQLRGLLTACVLLLSGWTPTRAAEPSRPVSTAVTVGPGYALVRETHALAVSRREESLLLDVPAEADRGSLSVSDEAGAVRLAEARWLAGAAPSPFSGSMEWPPRRASAPPGPRPDARVLCALRADAYGERMIEVRYVVSNLSWRAHYDLNIRGDIANQLEPLALDLEARYLVSNGLSRALRASSLELTGPDRVVPVPPRRHGFLLLDPESPLADRWRPARPRPEVPQLYRVERAVFLPAGRETAIRFASARRMPTERSYELDSDRVSAGPTSAWKPLRQILSFKNEPRGGLGFPLPPGTALIAAGAGRGSARQEALLDHTSAGEIIRVDMGDAAGVIGARRSLGRQVAAGGMPEETIELSIANNLPSAVRVSVRERPPVPLAWNMIRSSRKYEILARRLHYELELDARSEEVISYTVRLTEPEG